MSKNPESNVQVIEQKPTELDLLSQAFRDPEKFDTEKFNTIMRWRERERDLALLGAFNDALHAAQAKMLPIAADLLNPQTQSKYASYAALDTAIRPHYIAAGLSISFDTGESPLENHVRTLAYASCGAFTKTYHVDMPIVTTGIKGNQMMTLTHATASAKTYGKRYLLADIFNLAIDRDRDDDGNAAGAGDTDPKLTPEQVARLEKLIKDTKTNMLRFLKWARATELPAIRQSYYQSCVETLELRLPPGAPGAKK